MRVPARHVSLLVLAASAIMACMLLAGRPARAAAAPLARQLQHYVVEPGGGYRLTVEEVRTSGGTYRVDVDPGREHLLSLDAWVQKPDGRRVALALASAGGAVPPKTVVLPGV